MQIAKVKEYSTPATSLHNENRFYKTTNLLLREDRKFYYQYANGLKTGYTDAAKYCIIASATKDDRSLICVILHSDNTTDLVTSREMDCIRLFEYGFSKYSLCTLSSSGAISSSLKILNGTKDTNNLDILCKDDIKALIKTGEVIDVTPNIKITKFLAPISKGEVVGSITYVVDGISYSSDLIASQDVFSSSYANFIWCLVIILIILILIFILWNKHIRNNSKYKRKNINNKKRTNYKGKSFGANSLYSHSRKKGKSDSSHSKVSNNNFKHNKYML